MLAFFLSIYYNAICKSPVGVWLSWKSDAFATHRSRVRISLSPPKNKNAINLRSFFVKISKTVNPTESLAFEKRLRFQWFVLFLSDIPSERAVFCLVFETLRKFYKR